MMDRYNLLEDMCACKADEPCVYCMEGLKEIQLHPQGEYVLVEHSEYEKLQRYYYAQG